MVNMDNQKNSPTMEVPTELFQKMVDYLLKCQASTVFDLLVEVKALRDDIKSKIPKESD